MPSDNLIELNFNLFKLSFGWNDGFNVPSFTFTSYLQEATTILFRKAVTGENPTLIHNVTTNDDVEMVPNECIGLQELLQLVEKHEIIITTVFGGSKVTCIKKMRSITNMGYHAVMHKHQQPNPSS